MRLHKLLAIAILSAPGLMYGQFEFSVDGRDVQVHSFLSQGFAISSHNNYLTMNTSNGLSISPMAA